MAPGILLRDHEVDGSDERPSKKVKWRSEVGTAGSDDDGDIPSHPLGVKPSGNAYSSTTNSKSSAGFFSRLPDELVLQLLETLKARELLALGPSCRFLYAFASYDELWRALFVE